MDFMNNPFDEKALMEMIMDPLSPSNINAGGEGEVELPGHESFTTDHLNVCHSNFDFVPNAMQFMTKSHF